MNKKGFTLIELLVAISIMGIILVLVIPRVNNLRKEYELKKYDAYVKTVERAAKLYTDSNNREMFGHQDSGCVAVKYSKLKESNLLREYKGNGSCSTKDSDTFVNVRKIGDQYEYSTAIKCYNKSGKLVLEKNLSADTCSIKPDTDGPIIRINVTPKTNEWINLNNTTMHVEVELEDKSGFWENQTVNYQWYNASTGDNSVTRTLYFKNKRATNPKTLKKKIPNKYLPYETGEWKLIVFQDTSNNRTGVKDYLGNSNSIVVSSNIKIDVDEPRVPTSQIRYNNSSGQIRDNTSDWSKDTLWWGNFNATDKGSGVDHYEYSTNCTGEKNGDLNSFYTYETSRSWKFCIRAVDKAENVSDWSEMYYFNIDKENPNVPTSSRNVTGMWQKIENGKFFASATEQYIINSYNDANGHSCAPIWWGNFNATDNGPSGIDHYEYSDGCTNTKTGNLSPAYYYTNPINKKYCIRSVDRAQRVSGWSDPYYVHLCHCSYGQCDDGNTGEVCKTTTSTSSWSKCSEKCGPDGIKTRTITYTTTCGSNVTTKKDTETAECNRERCYTIQGSDYHVCPSDQNVPTEAGCNTRWNQYDRFMVKVKADTKKKVNITVTIGMNLVGVTVDGTCKTRDLCIASMNHLTCLKKLATIDVNTSNWLGVGQQRVIYNNSVRLTDLDEGDYRIILTGCEGYTKFRFATKNNTVAFHVKDH